MISRTEAIAKAVLQELEERSRFLDRELDVRRIVLVIEPPRCVTSCDNIGVTVRTYRDKTGVWRAPESLTATS